MKWFKHYSDMHDGRSVNNLMDELGHTGLCFFLLEEMCAEKLDASVKNLDESATIFHFHQRIVRQKLRISPANLRRLLDVCAANGLLAFEFAGNTLQISMPILLNLLDRDAKNARKTRENAAQKTRLEIELDRELELDKEKEVGSEPAKAVRKRPPPAPKVSLEGFFNQTVEVKEELYRHWQAEFGQPFVNTTLKKIAAYLLAKPTKTPKSDWGGFINRWLYKDWEDQRKRTPGGPTHKADAMMDHFSKLHAEINKEPA